MALAVLLMLIQIIHGLQSPSNKVTIKWINTVYDRHDLAKVISKQATKLVNLAAKSCDNKSIEVRINKIRVGNIKQHHVTDPHKLTLYLLRLMQIWNQIRRPNQSRYEKIKLYLANLIEFIELYLMQNLNKINLRKLHIIYYGLDYLFPDNVDALFFYTVLYYKPYTTWMSNGKLQCTQWLGSGSQADVVKVMEIPKNNAHLSSLRYYALKIFNVFANSNSCHQEEQIMHRIYNEIDNKDSDLRIPRIFGKNCRKTSTILMQYVNGRQLFDTHLTARKAQILLQQISKIIVKLGRIGIGHFDINDGNVLEDIHGNFWLIDFGLALNLIIDNMNETNSNIYELRLPLIGTFVFMAPQTIELNAFLTRNMIFERLENEHTVNITELIIKGNLYSLQAVTLWSLMDGNDLIIKTEIRRYEKKITEEWHNTDTLFSTNMKQYRDRIWLLFRIQLNRYFVLNLNEDESLTKDMFYLLNEKYTTNKDLYYASIQHKNINTAVIIQKNCIKSKKCAVM